MHFGGIIDYTHMSKASEREGGRGKGEEGRGRRGGGRRGGGGGEESLQNRMKPEQDQGF